MHTLTDVYWPLTTRSPVGMIALFVQGSGLRLVLLVRPTSLVIKF